MHSTSQERQIEAAVESELSHAPSGNTTSGDASAPLMLLLRSGLSSTVRLYFMVVLQLPLSGVLLSIIPSLLRACGLWKTLCPAQRLWGWGATVHFGQL